MAGNGYVQKVLLYFDIFMSGVVFRDPNITISARTGLEMRKEKPPLWARALNKFLNLFEKDHCAKAIQGDIGRARLALKMLDAPPDPDAKDSRKDHNN